MTERAHEQFADATTTVAGATTESTDSALFKDPESKKLPGSGPVSITMDVYHQLQQKRLLERQQQESLKQQQQQQQPQSQQSQAQDTANYFSQDGQSANPYEQQQGKQPSLETLEQIVSIVQATTPALPIVSTQTHLLPMPGPDLANIIFGTTPAAATASVGTNAESDNLVGSAKAATTATSNGHSGTGSNSHQHRKGAGGASGSQTQSQSQQPRTSSPPTPASGSSSGAQKTPATKGPKAIHAIELIRIAGEILQFPPATIGTSLVYYHKYRAYLHQAYKRGERDNEAFRADEYLFATACLHLACKCTEVSRKVRDLVNVTYRVMNPGQPALSLSTKVNDNSGSSSSSQQPQQQNTHSIAPPPTAATYWHIRDSLLTTELMLLRILQFDLDVSLPFSDVLRIYKGMGMVFSPTDEEAANLYPHASNFDVFLPAAQNQQQQPSHPSSMSPSKHGAPALPSSSSIASAMSNPTPHTGIHPTLSALVQISTTFCIDALCNSNIALHSSSRALAMGSIYLAIRSAGLDLPLPFEEWCYAWGRPMIATGFGIQVAGTSGPGGVGMGNSGVGTGVSGVNGIMGLTSGTNNLFVSSPRPTSDSASYMEGLELSSSQSGSGNSNGNGGGAGGATVGAGGASGSNGNIGQDPVYSQTHSPLLNSNNNNNNNAQSTSSPSVRASVDNLHGSQDSAIPQQPMTIVDEVRKVVHELGNFYTH
ncbi:hypothetical protein KI688_002492 [Linnemannia hyalina]|uniref:Uncharacterized protein n=1 Tax=Linnemannia hyalina TaxID=64524 RepID=A0A9P8BR78_9FUNG|nr:hypothetical protein KI688_002492 [Linnemannia hyalina]